MWGTQSAMIPWALCGGACVAATVLVWATDSRGCLPPYQGGSYAQSELGIYKDTYGLDRVEIIHIIGMIEEICRKLENQRASRGKKSGDFFARLDANIYFVENWLMSTNNYHIFFTH